MQSRTGLIVAILVATLLGCAEEKPAEEKLTPADAKAIANDGYIFGLPLVYIAVQADTQTNSPSPRVDGHRSTSSTIIASFPAPGTTR